MDGRRPFSVKAGQVFTGTIALVAGEVIAGILTIHIRHQTVAGYLGDYRGASDRKAEAVPEFDPLLGYVYLRQPVIVDKQIFRRRGQLIDSLFHSPAGSPGNSYFVDFIVSDRTGSGSDGLFTDSIMETFPGRGS